MKLHRLLILALAFPLVVHAQTVTTVLNDSFTTSTLNPTTYPTVTSTSTGYDIASTKNTTSTIGTGDLKLTFPATTSGFTEAQALFTNTPIQLATEGQYVRLTATFTATANVVVGGTGSNVSLGLYNSGGSAPVSGLQTSGLTTVAGSTFATGGTAGWQGYVGRYAFTGGSNATLTRPAQNAGGTASSNQELLFNNSGGGAYANPAGVNVGPTVTSTLALTQGSQYTMDLRLTFSSATGLLTIDSNLYSGAGTGSTPLFGQTNTTTAAQTLTTSFDGLAVGLRYSNTSNGAITIDFNNLLVTTGTIPEPSTWVMMLGGVGMLVGMRRRMVKIKA